MSDVDVSSLPEPLKSQVQKKLQTRPGSAPVFAKLMAQRALSLQDQQAADDTMRALVRTNRWSMISFALVATRAV